MGSTIQPTTEEALFEVYRKSRSFSFLAGGVYDGPVGERAEFDRINEALGRRGNFELLPSGELRLPVVSADFVATIHRLIPSMQREVGDVISTFQLSGEAYLSDPNSRSDEIAIANKRLKAASTLREISPDFRRIGTALDSLWSADRDTYQANLREKSDQLRREYNII